MKARDFRRSFFDELSLFVPPRLFERQLAGTAHLHKRGKTISVEATKYAFFMACEHLVRCHENVDEMIFLEQAHVKDWRRLSPKRFARSLFTVAGALYSTSPSAAAWECDAKLHRRLDCVLDVFFTQIQPRFTSFDRIQAAEALKRLLSHAGYGKRIRDLLRDCDPQEDEPSKELVGYLVEMIRGYGRSPDTFEFNALLKAFSERNLASALS